MDGEYERLTAVESIDRTLTLSSEVPGLELRARAGGEDLLSHAEERVARLEEAAAYREESAARQAAVRRAERETAARQAAEARVAELEARMAKVR